MMKNPAGKDGNNNGKLYLHAGGQDGCQLLHCL
jgi:hypothetical protein